MQEKKILIIDIETTGFLNAGGKIVEIGIVELNLTTGSRNVLVDELCYEDGLTYYEMGKAWIVKNSDS
jgi:DNA polymerase-3 subunit epsilon